MTDRADPMFVELDESSSQQLCSNDVHVIDLECKTRVFNFEAKEQKYKRLYNINAREQRQKVANMVLEKLRTAYTGPLTDLIRLRANTLDHFVFRLVNKRTSEYMTEESYIALSYRWKKPAEAFIANHGEGIVAPVSEKMFQAVLAERDSAREGLWYDQVCIDQHNEEEKATSIGAMDIIYSGARKVVVALDDVFLDHAETKFLEDFRAFWNVVQYLRRTEFKELCQGLLKDRFRDFELQPQMATVLTKVLSSECFERAWCNHEIRLAQDIVVLAHCADSSTTGKSRCARMPMGLLIVIIRLIRYFHYATIEDLGEIGRRTASYLEYKFDSSQYDMPYGAPTHAPRETADMNAAYTLTWELKAGGNPNLPLELRSHDANLDRVSIVLKASGLNLSLAIRTEEQILQATQDECGNLLFSLILSVWRAYHSLGLLVRHSHRDDSIYIAFDVLGNFGEKELALH